MFKCNNKWDLILNNETEKDYFKNLLKFLEIEYKQSIIYPPKNEIFNALSLTDFDDVKVVILGQDPYHEPNQAHGLAFSVNSNVPCPPSLKNIYKEIESDLNIKMTKNGNLKNWAQQGVLLLNCCLTVREHIANSHKNKGWEVFTNNIIKCLNQSDHPIVFLLWGNFAKAKSELITNPNHLILTAAHPSPLSASRGFLGCKHFSKANKFLTDNNMKPINWQN